MTKSVNKMAAHADNTKKGHISDRGIDLVETALKNMGLDPKDPNLEMPDMAKFKEALNEVLASRGIKLRKQYE